MNKNNFTTISNKTDNIYWYLSDPQSVLDRLHVQADTGLTEAVAQQRQELYGKNELQTPKKAGLMQRILHQLNDVLIIILLIAVVLSFILAFLHGDGFIEPFVILGVVILNLILAITKKVKPKRPWKNWINSTLLTVPLYATAFVRISKRQNWYLAILFYLKQATLFPLTRD